MRCAAGLALATGMSATLGQTAQISPPSTLRIHAPGSLRAALTDLARAFEAAQPGSVLALSFGASGLLKDRIAAGEANDVFASANMAHPQALAAGGGYAAVQRFARNTMCVLARPGLDVSPAAVLDRVLDPAVTLGTSTPRADPSGDYAWQVFDRIEADGRPGAAAALKARARQLTGGPASPPPPEDRSVYGQLVAQGAADLFIAYCTATVQAVRENAGQQSQPLPERVNVAADYGLTVRQGAPEAARRFADFVLSAQGQALLARHGFAPR